VGFRVAGWVRQQTGKGQLGSYDHQQVGAQGYTGYQHLRPSLGAVALAVSAEPLAAVRQEANMVTRV